MQGITVRIMNINFYDDPSLAPRTRDQVRIKQIAVFVHADGSRRIAVGFDLTPFIERPSLELWVRHEDGAWAGSVNIIETLDSNFHITVHLRDSVPTKPFYVIEAHLYYATPEQGRMVVDKKQLTFDASQGGQVFKAS